MSGAGRASVHNPATSLHGSAVAHWAATRSPATPKACSYQVSIMSADSALVLATFSLSIHPLDDFLQTAELCPGRLFLVSLRYAPPHHTRPPLHRSVGSLVLWGNQTPHLKQPEQQGFVVCLREVWKSIVSELGR